MVDHCSSRNIGRNETESGSHIHRDILSGASFRERNSVLIYADAVFSLAISNTAVFHIAGNQFHLSALDSRLVFRRNDLAAEYCQFFLDLQGHNRHCRLKWPTFLRQNSAVRMAYNRSIIHVVVGIKINFIIKRISRRPYHYAKVLSRIFKRLCQL